MKKIISGVLLVGVACSIFATDARVETMGRNSNFFADETSIHQNAANLGLYDKIIYGSYGSFRRNPDYYGGDSSFYEQGVPTLPYFGAAVSFGHKEGTQQKFSIGATFNRVDSALNFVARNIDDLGLRTTKLDGTGKKVILAGNQWDGANIVNTDLEFVGKIDLMAAYTLANGTTIGLGGYLAFQDGSRRNLIKGGNPDIVAWDAPATNESELKNRFVKGNIGVNTPIGDGVDLEASVGISALTLQGAVYQPAQNESQFYRVADNDIGVQLDVRMFADVASMNGAFVPHIQANIFNYGDGEKVIDFNAGLGINLNIDRGFFWAGLEGVYNKKSNALVRVQEGKSFYGEKDVIGGRVGFGIERNVLTDWFIIRVGGSKLLAKESRENQGGSNWLETSDQDHVSLGMGVNIEDRLKIDFTLSENIPYTFTSLFSNDNSTPYLATRVSAVFTF